MLARREQGTKPAEQTSNVTTGREESADDLVGLGNSLVLIFF